MGSGSTMVKQDPPPILQVLTMVGKDHPDNANNSGLQQQHRLGGVLWIFFEVCQPGFACPRKITILVTPGYGSRRLSTNYSLPIHLLSQPENVT